MGLIKTMLSLGVGYALASKAMNAVQKHDEAKTQQYQYQQQQQQQQMGYGQGQGQREYDSQQIQSWSGGQEQNLLENRQGQGQRQLDYNNQMESNGRQYPGSEYNSQRQLGYDSPQTQSVSRLGLGLGQGQLGYGNDNNQQQQLRRRSDGGMAPPVYADVDARENTAEERKHMPWCNGACAGRCMAV